MTARQLARLRTYGIILPISAGVVQLVEHLLAKEKVTSSSLVARSVFIDIVTKRRIPHSLLVSCCLLT